MLDLYRATHEELIRLLLAQQEQLAARDAQLARQERELVELRAAVAALTTRVGELSTLLAGDDDPAPPTGPPARMAGHRAAQTPIRAARPRKHRLAGSGRRRLAPTARVVHALAHCPDCGTPLAGGTVKRTREVIDLPPPRITVTAHEYVERRCPGCGRRCVPPPALGTLVSGQGRLGHGLTSLVAVLREEARLPVRTIQALLGALTGLHLSVGAIVGASQRLATRAEPRLAEITQAIRASPVVHLDETGWREAGRNGYVWTASTPALRLFRHGTRQKAMVAAILGDAFAGVVVSDFYAAYTNDERLHQYCWAHLLRDIHELVARHPADPVLVGWADRVGALFARAQVAAEVEDERTRGAARRALQAELRLLCAPWAQVEVPQRTLCTRILTHLESLFTFVTEPGVPATNNAAERSLRHLVVARKVSGGTRSAQGTVTRLTLASLFSTWRAQGRNPYLESVKLLATPQV